MTIDVPNSRGDATNYTCCLIRLIEKADPSNRHKLSTVYPNEVEAYTRWEAKAMRYIDPNQPKIGTIVIAGANNHCVEEGMKGIVYEHYDRTGFDNEAEDNTGLGLLFENGFYDGFSQHDLKTFQINITDESIPELEDYVFRNVTHLLEDFYRGKFKPAFHSEKPVNGNRQLNPRNCPILVIYVLLESTPEALTAQGRSFSSFSTVSA